MNKTELMKYCRYYRGESICPPEYDGKIEGKLWQTEMMICEDMPQCIDVTHPRQSLREYVAAYVGKWWPFQHIEILSKYDISPENA